ncbi:hypothetical protein EIP91_006448 [Steccherinum ochraceum]|uniref:DUF6589 domain-containing protein n=1 Tax=Steccherinum ochraceum TaxID=92696 RepID=A0A4R0R5K9_9APHY|nr:hypothetical protein EIP91_006448 [Steccherinum ochraceum]
MSDRRLKFVETNRLQFTAQQSRFRVASSPAALPPSTPLPLASSFIPPNSPVASAPSSPTKYVASFAAPVASDPKKLPDLDKLEEVLVFFDKLDWTTSEFLYHLLRFKDDDKHRIKMSPKHRGVVSHLLTGDCLHPMVTIFDLVLKHPFGRPMERFSPDMYSISPTPASSLKRARPGLTSRAVELVSEQIVLEMRNAVKGESGLHGSLLASRSGGRRHLSWEDVGFLTMDKTTAIFRRHSPLTYELLSRLATPPSGKEWRPVEYTVTEVLSNLAYCRTPYSRLLPATRGILYFACGAQQLLYRYSSRVSHTPSWNTTVATLKRLAILDAQFIRRMELEYLVALFGRLDNIQAYVRRQETRIGRTHYMQTGLTAYVAPSPLDTPVDPRAVDVDLKLAEVAKGHRMSMTTQKLMQLIDHKHHANVMTLQWLQVLVDHVPELSIYRGEVAKLFRSPGEGAKIPLPRTYKTPIYNLSCNDKNENKATDLKAAMLDFIGQTGQDAANYRRRLQWWGGDGLTFQRILELKRALRGTEHTDPFRQLDVVEPFLESWHTGWTYLTLTYETHWDSLHSQDPSKLGHSAHAINQKAPSNLKKVDYYPYLWLTLTVLSARILDCWRLHFETDDILAHFTQLKREGRLPSLDSLRSQAHVLWERYTSRRSVDQVKTGRRVQDLGIPAASPWRAPAVDPSSAESELLNSSLPQQGSGTSSSGHAAESNPNPSESTPSPNVPTANTETPAPFEGDESLAHSMTYMRDTMLVQEFVSAVADGDPGRSYEAMKMMLFHFAGSSHTKYCSYLLETICRLEYESVVQSKDLFLHNWLVNPSGEAGKWQAGDFCLEKNIRELQTKIQHKDTSFDSNFVRTVVSPNLSRFVDLKSLFCLGLGLAKRHGFHAEPHERVEIKTLLAKYQETNLHSFRAGRHYASEPAEVPRNLDTFTKGAESLENGKLAKWIEDSIDHRVHVLPKKRNIGVDPPPSEPEEDEADMPLACEATMGTTEMVDGGLVVEPEALAVDWEAEMTTGEQELDSLDTFVDELERQDILRPENDSDDDE